MFTGWVEVKWYLKEAFGKVKAPVYLADDN